MASPLHARTVVLPDGEQHDVYVVDGQITFDRPTYLEIEALASIGFMLPGLADAHCHGANATAQAVGGAAAA